MDLESFGKKKKKKKRAGIDLADEEADKDAGKLRMDRTICWSWRVFIVLELSTFLYENQALVPIVIISG